MTRTIDWPKRWSLIVPLACLGSLALVARVAMATPPAGTAAVMQATTTAQPPAAPLPAATYIGMKECRDCHRSEVLGFARTTHGRKSDQRTPAAKHECETCHGPGSNHAQGPRTPGHGGITWFDRTSSLTARQKNAVCLQCHQRGRQLWRGSKHESRGLACVDCHKIHGGNETLLAKATVMDTCFQCHKQIKADTQKMSHHPLREGKMTCTDCHNPHGTQAPKLIAANYVNEKCYECHTEKRGPFLWSHPPVSEDCLNCHTPHGSNHDKLLKLKRPYLCQTCHGAGSRHPGTLYAITGVTSVYGSAPALGGGVPVAAMIGNPGNRLAYRGCSNCHTQIHGSNHPSGKYFQR